jgi:carotenoid cleavage dioxygenase-like enzyme
MHSFGITERYFVLAEFPLVVNPIKLATSGLAGRAFIDNYEWKPERGTRFQVIDRSTGELRGTYEAEACFGFHHVNAFEHGGALVVDLCSYEDPSLIQVLEVQRLRDRSDPLPQPELRRFRIPLDGAAARSERVSDAAFDLPRINYRSRNEREYRYAYGAGFASADSEWFDRVVKVDVTTGESKAWSQDGCFPGEGVFVAAPDAKAEDDGVVMSVVLDPAAGRSFLAVIDASSFEELGRAEAPHHIPHGFHGQFFSG